MRDRVLAHEKIVTEWNQVVTDILGVEEKEVSGVRLRHVETGEEKTITCKGVFIAIGHVPNTKPFAGQLELDESGYLLPAPGSMIRTKVPGVYAAGDCADHVYRQAITAAGMGCQAAIEAERWLAEQDF